MSKPVQLTDNKKKTPHAVELKFGYQDAEEPDVRLKSVRLGMRPRAAVFIRASVESGGSDLQFSIGLAQSAIVEFGQMTMPVPMTVLLALNQIDREIMTRAYFSFLVDTGRREIEVTANTCQQVKDALHEKRISANAAFIIGELPHREQQIKTLNDLKREDGKAVKDKDVFIYIQRNFAGEGFLTIGIERNKQTIKVFKFGRLLTGYDEIEIERESTGQWNANVLRMIKEIVEPNDLTATEIETLDVDDFTLLRNAEEQWLNSFRGE